MQYKNNKNIIKHYPSSVSLHLLKSVSSTYHWQKISTRTKDIGYKMTVLTIAFRTLGTAFWPKENHIAELILL